MKRWLFLLLFFPVIAFGQFRMVSSTVTLDSTVNDSTYIIDVDFFSDQTAKGYFASGITADYRVFSQTGQLYDITAATNLTLSSGDLTIVEIDNDYVNTESAPVGQILVFDPQGDYITFTPFGNQNMGQVLQQAIGTYNSVVSDKIPTVGYPIMITDKSVVREELLLNGDTLSGVDKDTTLLNPSDKKVPSTQAVVKYVRDNAGVSAVRLADSTAAAKAAAESYDNSVSGVTALSKQAFLDSISGFRTLSNISALNVQKATIKENQTVELRSTGHRYKISDTNLSLYTSSYPSDTSAVIPLGGGKWLTIQPDKSGVYPFSAFGGTNNGHNDDDGIAFQKANSFARARVALGLGRTIIDFEANAFYKIDTTGHIPQLINRVADSSVWRGNGSIIYVVPHEATLTQATYNIFDIQGSTSIEFHDFEFKSTGKFDGVRYLQESGNPNWESNSTRSNIAIFEGNETLSAVMDGTGNKNIVLKNIIFRDIYYPIRLSCSEGCLIENVQIYNPKDGIRAYRTWNSIINNVRVDMDTLPSSNFKTKALYVVDVFNTQLSNFTITGDFNVPIRIDGTEVSVDTCNAVFNNFKLYEVGQTEFSDGAWVANNWTITSPKYEGETAAYLFSFAGGTTSSHPILNNITVDNSNPKMIPIIGTSVSNTNFDLNNFNSTGPIRFATTGASNVGITINNSKINTPWESATYFPNSLFDYDDTGSTGNVRINNLSIITEDEAQNNPRIVEGYGLDITFDKLSIKDEGTTDFIWMFRQEHSSGSISVRNSDFRGVSFDDFASFTGGATEANMPLNNVYLNDGTYILNDVYDSGVRKASDLTGLDGSSSLTETGYLAAFATDMTGTNTRLVEKGLVNPKGGSNNIQDIVDSLSSVDAGNVGLSDIAGNFVSTSVEGALQELGNLFNSYGGMYAEDSNPDTLTFASSSTTPIKASGLTAGLLSNFTYSSGRLTYIGNKTAVFIVQASSSYSFSENSTEVEGWIYKNGSVQNKIEFHRTIGNGGDIGSSSLLGLVELSNGDYIEAFFAPISHTGTNDLILMNLNVIVKP